MQPYTTTSDLSNYHSLLSGDLSGIQDFIFNIQSEGAAKTLKARSFYVQALSELCLAMIEKELGAVNCLLFYNGGGNFYVFCTALSEQQLGDLRKAVQSNLADLEIYLSLSVTRLNTAQFRDTWAALHRQSNQDKLRKFAAFPHALTVPKRYQTDNWKKFVKVLTIHKGFRIQPAAETDARISEDCVSEFGYRFDLTNQNKQFEGSIQNKLPEWTDGLLAEHADYIAKLNARNKSKDPETKAIKKRDIIEFETFGHFAHTRTGTDKIAVLKMDADGLGDLFLQINDVVTIKQVSDALKNFFDQQLYQIWSDEKGFEYTTWDSKNEPTQRALFSENIYVVFAGGDDCLMIGAWDAVFEFAERIQSAFENFGELKKIGLSKTLTISASLTILDSKFPVVRMGALADDALTAAKYAVPDEKNRISVFNRILTWEEFRKARKIAFGLETSIKNEKEPRSMLNRVQVSHLGFEKLMERAINTGNIYNPAVWRLFYFIRNSKKADRLQEVMDEYQQALLDAAMKKKRINGSALFPVAARWAELLTR